ncbi:MAG: ABC transporter permease [Spirochaetes bacterium]|nr:ABC transporter permease [Spirochaetota bacterium]
MYKWYAVKRIVNGLVVFAIILFLMSILFNAVNEETMRSSIKEQVRSEAQRLKGQKPEQIIAFQKQRQEQLVKLYKLDRPFGERIVYRWLDALTFRFGKATILRSNRGDRDVLAIILEALPRSMLLFTTSMVLELIFGIYLGMKKAQKPGGKLDRSTSLITMIVFGMPTWWLAMLLIMAFVYGLRLFPSAGIVSVPPPDGIMRIVDVVWHMILPMATLTVLAFWGVAFTIRNIVLGILQEDYIMSARARGIPENKVLFGHTMRTAAPPLVTMSLLGLLGSFSGAIIFEGIFSWPGLGNLYWIAVQQSDIPVLMGDLALTTAIFQVGYIILDLTYGFLDPRIKVGGNT